MSTEYVQIELSEMEILRLLHLLAPDPEWSPLRAELERALSAFDQQQGAAL